MRLFVFLVLVVFSFFFSFFFCVFLSFFCFWCFFVLFLVFFWLLLVVLLVCLEVFFLGLGFLEEEKAFVCFFLRIFVGGVFFCGFSFSFFNGFKF